MPSPSPEDWLKLAHNALKNRPDDSHDTTKNTHTRRSELGRTAFNFVAVVGFCTLAYVTFADSCNAGQEHNATPNIENYDQLSPEEQQERQERTDKEFLESFPESNEHPQNKNQDQNTIYHPSDMSI